MARTAKDIDNVKIVAAGSAPHPKAKAKTKAAVLKRPAAHFVN